MWGIVIVLLVPLYLRTALDDPADYAHGGVGANDFKAYYIAGRLLARGQDIYSAPLSVQEMDGLGLPQDNILYMYPSMIAIVTLPLANLSLENAARIWNLINLGWMTAALYFVTVALQLRQVLGNWYVWFVILFAISVPATGAIRVGQANVLLLFLLSLALFAVQRMHPAVAGIAIGVASLIKVFPALLFLWWLWRRERQIVAWGAGTIASILIACGLFLVGTGRDVTTDLRFFTQILPHLSAPLPNDNQSLYGFFSHFDLDPFWIQIGAMVTSVFILVGTLFALIRAPKERTTTLQFGLVITVLLLVSTITWSTTNILLLLPIAVLVQQWALRNRSYPFYALLGIAYVSLGAARWFGWISYSPPMLAWLLGLGTIGMLMIWGLLIYELSSARHGSGQFASKP